MLWVKRPGNGIAAAKMQEIIGKTAKSDIAADESIKWEYIQ